MTCRHLRQASRYAVFVYQFSIDYSRLSADPNAGKGGGWVYAPGAPAAVWR